MRRNGQVPVPPDSKERQPVEDAGDILAECIGVRLQHFHQSCTEFFCRMAFIIQPHLPQVYYCQHSRSTVRGSNNRNGGIAVASCVQEQVVKKNPRFKSGSSINLYFYGLKADPLSSSTSPEACVATEAENLPSSHKNNLSAGSRNIVQIKPSK